MVKTIKIEPETNELDPTNVPGLYKNRATNVVVNTNVGEYQRVLAARKKLREDAKQRLELSTLKQEVGELRSMFRELIDVLGKKNG